MCLRRKRRRQLAGLAAIILARNTMENGHLTRRSLLKAAAFASTVPAAPFVRGAIPFPRTPGNARY